MAQPKGSFIHKIPNEILARILEFCTACEDFTVSTFYTCRRFYELGTPFQYRSITLDAGYFIFPMKTKVKALHRTIQEKPAVGQYCHEFRVLFRDFHEDRDYGCIPINLRILKDIASALTNVRVLRLEQGFFGPKSEYTWNFFSGCLDSMPYLHKVSVFGGYDSASLPLHKVMEILHNTSVRSVSIGGVECSSQNQSFEKLPICGTSNITELKIFHYLERPHGISYLVHWPKVLTSLSIASSHKNRHYIDLPMIGSMLGRHKDTLIKLSIGTLTMSGRGKLLDFSTFPALEDLELSMWQIKPSWDDESGQKNHCLLLAPNLKIFRIRFTIGGRNDWNDFGQQAQSWLQDFAEAAITRKIPLREISVYFRPEICTKEGNDGYPWDLMDAVGEELRPNGINVTYSAPTLSREDWIKGDVNHWFEAAYADYPSVNDEFPDLEDEMNWQ